jgi:hypothetical protein
MGYATTRSLERVAAAMGELESAPIEFEAAADIPEGGVLLALPALLAAGLLRHTPAFYELPQGYYGIESIFLLLAMMALARLTAIEQLRYIAPGEWGGLLGLDRVPEVRCLRNKLEVLCRQQGQAGKWNTELAKDWMGELADGEMLFLIDGHVRVYHGEQTELPRHHVARQKLCLRATTDYWINAMDGQPFFYVNKEADPGLLTTLRQDVVPWLEANAPLSAEQQARMAADPRLPWFTLIFDREGYSPDFFREMATHRVAILSYHKFAGPDWPVEEFVSREVKLAGSETVRMPLAERERVMSNGLAVREIRKRTETGQQVPIVTTNFVMTTERLAAAMFGRWSQENYFKYMREHYGLDQLVEYAVEPVPATVSVVNPARRKLDADIRTLTARIKRESAKFNALSLKDPLETESADRYHAQKTELHQTITDLQGELDKQKAARKPLPKRVPIGDLPESARFQRLRPERKHFLDTIKMIAYRAETAMASVVRERLARDDDARALLRHIFHNEADLVPDLLAKTLTVRLHHLAQNAHDAAARHLCVQLNATETIFPGTDLRLVYEIGSM